MLQTKHRDAPDNRNANDPVQEEALRESRITPELVDEIADKVYAMLLLDLRIERERQHLPQRPLYGQGGW